jgi:organic radical activating enzyme
VKCAWIENMMSIETDGFTRPCCLETDHEARISPITDGIIVAFNHPKLLKLREDLKKGYSENTRSFCRRCEELEVNGNTSLRMTAKQMSETRQLKVLQFKMSNKCQLACAHCGPERSSGWAKIRNIKPHVINSFEVTDKFIDELKQLLPQLEVLKFTGGEPFLDPNHWKILEALKNTDRKHCKLEYITNGISPVREHLWEGWGEVKCSVSVDGFEKTYEWFRRGATWTELLHGVKKLNNICKVSVNYSVTPFTAEDYLKSKEFWKYSMTPFPIVRPYHASLAKFPRSIIEQMPNYQEIPFWELTSTEGNQVTIYKKWAHFLDKKWNTPGLSEKLYWWLR